MTSITIREIKYNTREYEQELILRNKVLRIPLGLNLFEEDLSGDKDDFHAGAFFNEKLVGCLLLKPESKGILKMRQVAVDPEYQNMGIGSAMVDFSEQYAKSNGFSRITMHARKTAVEFYKKLGYEVIGDEFEEVLVPHYVMEKDTGFTGKLRIEKVTDSTLGQFASILAEAAQWMISKGFDNWDPETLTISEIKKNSNPNELFICYMEDQSAGCIKLQECDDIFWPDAAPGEALYVHKLAVKRKYAGAGISNFMLEWAKEQARERNRKYLRLDCIADRQKLCDFYTRQGFEKADECHVLKFGASARFEYKV